MEFSLYALGYLSQADHGLAHINDTMQMIQTLNREVPDYLQRLLFFSFFRQTTELTLYVPLSSTDFNRYRRNTADAGPSPCFSQKLFRAFANLDEIEGSPVSIFSAV